MNENRKILIFERSYILADHLVKRWKELAQEAIRQRGRFTVALSGGRTPSEFYIKLSAVQEPEFWLNTHLFQVDERYLPHDHPDSNLKLIKENLLNYVPIPKRNLHPVPVD